MRSRVLGLGAATLVLALAGSAIAEEEPRKVSVYVGLEFGAVGLEGFSGAYDNRGFGRGLLLGVGGERFGVEWQAGQVYRLGQPDSDLDGEGLDGKVSMSTIAVRFWPVEYVSASLGFMRVTIPALASSGELNEPERQNIAGQGGVGGLAAHIPMLNAFLTIEGRVGKLMWELPRYPYLVDRTEAAGGGYTYGSSNEGPDPWLWTATIGIRTWL